MAKSSIRKTDPVDTTAPARRRRTTAADNGEKPAARTRRKTAPADVAAGATALAVEADTEQTDEVLERVLSHEQIAVRAYHLYLERGKTPGDQLLDWVTAERELREQFSRAR